MNTKSKSSKNGRNKKKKIKKYIVPLKANLKNISLNRVYKFFLLKIIDQITFLCISGRMSKIFIYYEDQSVIKSVQSVPIYLGPNMYIYLSQNCTSTAEHSLYTI